MVEVSQSLCRERVQIMHPDKQPDEENRGVASEAFLKLQEAYEVALCPTTPRCGGSDSALVPYLLSPMCLQGASGLVAAGDVQLRQLASVRQQFQICTVDTGSGLALVCWSVLAGARL